MPRHLFIVSRETPYLADYMREQFRDEPDVEIIVDRREGERADNGTEERRARREVDQQLRVAFHAFVTVE
jgi:hypothetical protein